MANIYKTGALLWYTATESHVSMAARMWTPRLALVLMLPLFLAAQVSAANFQQQSEGETDAATAETGHPLQRAKPHFGFGGKLGVKPLFMPGPWAGHPPGHGCGYPGLGHPGFKCGLFYRPPMPPPQPYPYPAYGECCLCPPGVQSQSSSQASSSGSGSESSSSSQSRAYGHGK